MIRPEAEAAHAGLAGNRRVNIRPAGSSIHFTAACTDHSGGAGAGIDNGVADSKIDDVAAGAEKEQRLALRVARVQGLVAGACQQIGVSGSVTVLQGIAAAATLEHGVSPRIRPENQAVARAAALIPAAAGTRMNGIGIAANDIGEFILTVVGDTA